MDVIASKTCCLMSEHLCMSKTPKHLSLSATVCLSCKTSHFVQANVGMSEKVLYVWKCVFMVTGITESELIGNDPVC